ncbi:dihydrodipicolinate synthase family protein [Pseudonocardia charpentierae]|uniref:Dihydrodipicolinate synthase family protein n=1 Tax=Pseudonocardia charpentierae TaxID=3075545 RepID=A0ABU2NGS1_9PSEU|nr:dihydrodipicolinate synthase family protein [Pseudonocardia sp. DSM 45834]MDT0353089.1 dihydrodipicolinate synthase family protein [Pseudonocardia sp. DSM 45834]
MTTTDLAGVLVALVTPFTADGNEIDAVALEAHVDRLIREGAHGFVPGGSTGEFTTLTLDERKQLTELVVKAASGRVPVVAGTGALSTRDAIELATHAAETGADALMVVPPFYDAVELSTFKELLREIYAASGLPIMFYNIPSATGLSLTAAEIASLAEVDGVRYLKDTSGDAVALTELLQLHGDKITTFNGWDTLTFYGIAAGAKGSVWGATNVIPELSRQLWDALAVDGDLVRGRELWAKIYPICRFLEQYNYAAAVKTGMQLRGYATGPIRKPFALLEGEARAELARLLRDAGVEVVD